MFWKIVLFHARIPVVIFLHFVVPDKTHKHGHHGTSDRPFPVWPDHKCQEFLGLCHLLQNFLGLQ